MDFPLRSNEWILLFSSEAVTSSTSASTSIPSQATTSASSATLAKFDAVRSLCKPWDDNLKKHERSNLMQCVHCMGKPPQKLHFWWLCVQCVQLHWFGEVPLWGDPFGLVVRGGKRLCPPFTRQWWHDPFVWGKALHWSCLSWQLVHRMGKGKSNAKIPLGGELQWLDLKQWQNSHWRT